MPVALCGRDVPLSKSFVVLTSQLLSAFGGDATIIFCMVANLGKKFLLEKGFQYPFSLTPLQFEQLLHKPSFSVIDKIDLFHASQLLLRVKKILDDRLVQSTDFFRRVNIKIRFGLCFIEFTFNWDLVYYRLWNMVS